LVIFEKLRWKNFLATGDVFSELSFNIHPTTLITGGNGNGKSTFLDALTFSLFGKSFRKVNKPNLINSINNRDLVVEIEFTIGTQHYFIRRGIKPNIFEVFVNGKMLDQDSKIKDYQLHLEQNILKLNYKSFCQIVVLGSSNFVPFMQLSAADRRYIIEDLLDIQIFSQMNVLLKERVIETRDQLSTIETRFEIESERLKLQYKYLNDIKADNKAKIKENKEQIQTNKETRSQLVVNVKELQHEIKKLLQSVSNYDKINNKFSKLQSIKSQSLDSIVKVTTDITYFENTESCKTCKQSIDEKFKIDTVATKKLRVVELNQMIMEINIKIDECTETLNSAKQIFNEVRNKELEVSRFNSSISAVDSFIEKVNKEIEKLQNKRETSDVIDAEKLNELKTQLIELEKQKGNIVEKRYHYDIVSIMLKDSGIKTRIIRQYLPIMNKLINKFLGQMDFFVNFNLDENFKEVIKSRGRDEFCYESFSEGEKTRINLAILFAWRAISKLKNSVNTNILIFDEIMDSSLDNEGLDDFIKMVHEISGNNTNVTIISHRNADNMMDKFSSVLKFDKVKNFSIMSVVS
jgi:DNA repair exonuclease SbcCD ATPase subunit